MVTTLEIAASTMAPSTPELQVPITSSITKGTDDMGELKAAARPAAAPTGAIKRTFACERLRRRPMAEAIPAPICSDGSSGPKDWPLPIASAQVRNFPTSDLNGTYPLEMYSADVIWFTPLPRACGKT